jgi:subtilisin family serine protease
MQALSDKGILLVTAAGNDGHDLDGSPDYPAVLKLPNQLTVGALRSDGYVDYYSNSSYTFVQLVAPGTNILSTVVANKIGYMTGTSMATPFVSGAAALLWSARPQATAAQIRQALMAGVDPGNYRVETQGRLNVAKALAKLLAQ